MTALKRKGSISFEDKGGHHEEAVLLGGHTSPSDAPEGLGPIGKRWVRLLVVFLAPLVGCADGLFGEVPSADEVPKPCFNLTICEAPYEPWPDVRWKLVEHLGDLWMCPEETRLGEKQAVD